MKKWIPFASILLVALVLVINLILGGNEKYRPTTSDPEVVYKEACLECHGNGDQAANLWSPDLTASLLTVPEVRQIVSEGNWRMPAFPFIPDSILDSLSVFVADKKFVKRRQEREK